MQFVLRARLNEKQAKSMQQVYGFQILYVLQFISFDILLLNNIKYYIVYKIYSLCLCYTCAVLPHLRAFAGSEQL